MVWIKKNVIETSYAYIKDNKGKEEGNRLKAKNIKQVGFYQRVFSKGLH